MSANTSQQLASITICPHIKKNPIDRSIYAGFIEHMGRAVYGGIYDPHNPNRDLVNDQGFRKDVIESLKPLGVPVFRYPGGNFCATYHWLDGVGPVEKRPRRPDLAWGNVDPNTFGTDEFMLWCKQMDTQPYFCLNFGTGTLDEAMAWLEYCNGTGNTYYANMRKQNGHEEPYKVKYWALGNECWGPWQVMQDSDPKSYAERALQWAKALKLLDPAIELVLCGKDGASSWDYEVLKHCLRPAALPELREDRSPLIDMHSIHLYTESEDHYENATAPLGAERCIEICSGLIDLASKENSVPCSQKRPKICVDEWNVWSPLRAPGTKGAEEFYTLSDALAIGIWLNVLVRNSADVGMACLAQSVNVISPLMTTTDGVIKQTTWWPYELFCKYMRGYNIAVYVNCKEHMYTGRTKPEWIRGVKDTPLLDVSASYDEVAGMVNVCVVNLCEDKGIEVEMIGVELDPTVEILLITGESVGVGNMSGEAEVAVQQLAWDGHKSMHTFPKHSITMLRLKL